MLSVRRHRTYKINGFPNTGLLVSYSSKEIHLLSCGFLLFLSGLSALLTRRRELRLAVFAVFGVELGSIQLRDVSEYSVIHEQTTEDHLLDCLLDTFRPLGCNHAG